MNKNEINMNFTKLDIPQTEQETIDENMVLFNRTWTFSETHESYTRTTNSNWLYKKIFNFNDIIAFWQFWNKYPKITDIFFDGEQFK